METIFSSSLYKYSKMEKWEIGFISSTDW
jgi:hypothetical protein